VKPFGLKGLFNVLLLILTSILAKRSNGLIGGHAHLGHGLLGLKKDSLEGVLSVEVLATPLRQEVVEEEAP
jgi:hypothetical protein